MKLKRALVPRGYDGLLCEVDGCIVNINTGLRDDKGRRVTRVSISCDGYAGEPQWTIEGRRRSFQAVRVIEKSPSRKDI